MDYTSVDRVRQVLYLSDETEFEGADLAFGDGTRFSPQRGQAILFSSGWENPHVVQPLESGTRFAFPAFFTTEPAHAPLPFDPEDEASRAAALWRLGLMPQSLDDFLLFMQHWAAFFDEEE